MSKPENIANIRKRVAPLGFAVVHIDALRVALVYLDCRDAEADLGVGLGEYGSALHAVDEAIEAHDRALLPPAINRRRATPTT